jgi:hypothetical protein
VTASAEQGPAEVQVGAQAADRPKIVYWHRELPPLEAEAIGEHTVEAASSRVADTIECRDELWKHVKNDLADTP